MSQIIVNHHVSHHKKEIHAQFAHRERTNTQFLQPPNSDPVTAASDVFVAKLSKTAHEAIVYAARNAIRRSFIRSTLCLQMCGRMLLR